MENLNEGYKAELKRKLDDAHQAIYKCQEYIEHWQEQKRGAYQDYYRAKAELKTLTEKANV